MLARVEDNPLVPWAEQGLSTAVVSVPYAIGARACPRLSHPAASRKNLNRGKGSS